MTYDLDVSTNGLSLEQQRQVAIETLDYFRFHVRQTELCCHDDDCTPYPLPDEASLLTLLRLCFLFELLRQHCGFVPLKIASCYRTLAYHRTVSKNEQSQHLLGTAMDVHIRPDIMDKPGFWNGIQRWGRFTKGLGGLGLYDWGVHIDIRPRKDDGTHSFWDMRDARKGQQ